MQEKFQVVRQQDTHVSRVVSVKYFLQIDNIFITEFVGDVCSRVEYLISVQILSEESHSRKLSVFQGLSIPDLLLRRDGHMGSMLAFFDIDLGFGLCQRVNPFLICKHGWDTIKIIGVRYTN